MLYAAKNNDGKLSFRLSRVYATLFAAILLLLSIGVFFVAYEFLAQKQSNTIIDSMELIIDRVLEENNGGKGNSSRKDMPLSDDEEEDEDEGFDREILEELNTNFDLNMFLRDDTGRTVSRILNYDLDESQLPSSKNTLRLYRPQKDRLLLCYEKDILEGETPIGTLYLALNLRNELGFLKLLGILLIGANIVGWLAALLVGRETSRRMLAPIDCMISAAQSIGSDCLSTRLEVPEPEDELRRLALTINGMLDRVEDAFERQGRFTADASHELRTPLAVLQGNADMLERWGRSNPEVLDKSIHTIQRQTRYINKLVENLLFLARGDSGNFVLAKTNISVEQLFDELIEEQRMLDASHDYEKQTHPDHILFADRNLVKQFMCVLLDNSVKYTPEVGKITLISSNCADGILLSVSDTGIGMEEGDLHRAFERFFRADKSRSRASGNLGLGLSIAKAIVIVHEGSIFAKSLPGKGTTITAFFPKNQTGNDIEPECC